MSALQDILKTCEEFAASHNLKFSTDPDSVKCKTKCMAFLKKPRDLPSMILCGNPLPWVDSLNNLGTKVTIKIDGCQQDKKQKIARYVDRNCKLNQEFNFSHPETKLMINRIYNCHFSGAQVWDLFSPGVTSFEGAFNRSVKVMAGLPYATHRYLVGNIAGGHMKLRLIRNYLGFIKRIQKSSKLVLRQLYQLVCTDVRTVTGSNLRNIMIVNNTAYVDDVHPDLVNKIKYHVVEVNQM